MNKLTFESGDVIWPAIIGVVVIQLMVSGLVFFIYPVLAWMFFGEGANSFLYTNENVFVWIILPVLLPTLLNAYRIYIAKKKNYLRTFKVYIGLETGLLLSYTLLLFWWESTHSFYI